MVYGTMGVHQLIRIAWLQSGPNGMPNKVPTSTGDTFRKSGMSVHLNGYSWCLSTLAGPGPQTSDSVLICKLPAKDTWFMLPLIVTLLPIQITGWELTHVLCWDLHRVSPHVTRPLSLFMVVHATLLTL